MDGRGSKGSVPAQYLSASDCDGAEGGFGAANTPRIEKGQGFLDGNKASFVMGKQVKLHRGVGVPENQNVGLPFHGTVGSGEEVSLDTVLVSVDEEDADALHGDQLFLSRIPSEAVYN